MHYVCGQQKGGINLKNCLIVLGMILVAGAAFAADIDGKWAGEVPGMDGSPMKIAYTFKADGATLTGSTTSPDGKEMAIKDGKINGNNLSFSIAFDMGGQEMKMEMKGVLSGDTLKLSMDMMGQPMDFTLKKVK
jgi:hypothetical protein